MSQFDFINSVKKKYAAKGGSSSAYVSRFAPVRESLERYRSSQADYQKKREKEKSDKAKAAERAASKEQSGAAKWQENFNAFAGSISNSPVATKVPNIPTHNPLKPVPMSKVSSVMDKLMVYHMSTYYNWDKLNKKLASVINEMSDRRI